MIQLMKAMIFAAGLGTRLRPLTDDRPKALVRVEGITLLEIAIRRLISFGCREVVVNVHHFAEQIMEFLLQQHHFGITIHVSDERGRLLDTGGGLKQAASYLADAPFLVHNVDILTNLNLAALYEQHLADDAIATLAVRRRSSSRYLLFDEQQLLCGWRNVRSGERRYCRPCETSQDWAFSGIHVIDPAIFEWMPEPEAFSIIDLYLEIGDRYAIRAYPHDQDHWLDVGKPEALAKAAELLPEVLPSN